MPADDLFTERRRKVDELAALGVPAYNVDFSPSASLDGARRLLAGHEAGNPPPTDGSDAPEGPEVRVAGRVMQYRMQGRSCFVHIEDEGERMQVWFRADRVGDEQYAVVRLVDYGDLVGVRGRVMRTRRGEPTIVADEVT